MQTLLIGLDAACHRVLDPLFEAGRCPNLRSLFDGGTAGPLESQIPPWTASAWPSLYTGTNPGKHGVFGFLAFEGYDWSVVDATRVRERPLWEHLDHHGRSSVVVNVPVTHPPRPFDGAIVPGYTAPEDPPCHPEGLLAEVRDAVGDYRVYAAEEGSAADDPAAQVADLRELATLRGRAVRYLDDRIDPDFGFVQFQVTDTVCHQFPGDLERIGAVYAAVDDQVGAILADGDPATVVVASDHGIGPYDHRVAVNEALRGADFVETTRDGEAMPTWATLREESLRDGAATGATSAVAARVVAGLARLGLTTQRVGAALERAGLARHVQRVVPDALLRAGSERVDFPRSVAYARSRVECGVRLNLAGREPDGVVEPADYEATRDAVVDLLAGLTTPEGDPVFETVAPRERFFDGPAVEDAADVVAVPAGFRHYVTTWLIGRTVEPVDGPAWDHRREGVVALAGEGVATGTSLEGAHLFDVAPTVLATLGVPADERMDGRSLPPVEPVGTDAYPAFERDAEPTETGEAVQDRLADLGYLE